MKKLSARLGAFVLAIGLGSVVGAQPAQANYTSCPVNFSCYWEGNQYTGKVLIPDSAGCYDLSKVGWHWRISSYNNRGHGTAHLYDSRWYKIDILPVGTHHTLGASNNLAYFLCID